MVILKCNIDSLGNIAFIEFVSSGRTDFCEIFNFTIIRWCRYIGMDIIYLFSFYNRRLAEGAGSGGKRTNDIF